MEDVANPQSFALDLDLGAVPASLDDVLIEIGNQLDDFQPRLAQTGSHLRLSLIVRARDLWLAVLLAMAAVTSTGYPVVRLDVRPVDEPGRHRVRRTVPVSSTSPG